MCGRFTVSNIDPAAVSATFDIPNVPGDLPARYNVAPTQPIFTVVNTAEGANALQVMFWGLIPSWAKDASGASKLINARSETLAEKPSFRTALNKRRCLIVADGFYEWRKEDEGPKTPMHIRLKAGGLFGFAGLYERWTDPADGEPRTTCTIITTQPNELMASIHNRMPVIMPPQYYADWLDYKHVTGADLLPLLAPYPADLMTAYPVSRAVNNAGYENESLIQPV